MMKRRLLSMMLLGLLAGPVPTAAQAPSVFPGKVRIASTAADALCVGATTTSPASSACTGGLYVGPIIANGTVTATGTIGTTASLNAGQTIVVTNTSNGTAATALLQATNDGGSSLQLLMASSGYTPGSGVLANGSRILANGAGGLSVMASNAAGDIRVYSGGTTERWQWNESGHYIPNGGATYNIGDGTNTVGRIFVAAGSAANPSFTFGSTSTGFAHNIDGNTEIDIVLGGVSYGYFDDGTSIGYLRLAEKNVGGAGPGAIVDVRRNSAGGNTAPGCFSAQEADGSSIDGLYPDNSGVWRSLDSATYATNCPDNSLIASGTVVGSQSSTRESKHVLGAFTDTKRALDIVTRAPLWTFRYKQGVAGTFVGVMSDTTPEVMMDPSSEHPEGRSFSPISAFGYTAAAMRELRRQVEQLQRDVASLRRGRR